MTDWLNEFRGSVTLCDKDAKIIYMNDKSEKTFADYGGRNLVGTSLLDCHNENSQKIIIELIQSGRENIYTIEKNGRKKLIYQAATFQNGEVSGLVELSLELPEDMPHFIRDKVSS